MSSEELSNESVVMIDSCKGVFSVRSYQSQAEYHVSFEDSRVMPKCTCPDWCSTFLPCKHFFLVMRAYAEWKWDRLPSDYKDSVFFTLDNQVLSNATASSSIKDNLERCPENDADTQHELNQNEGGNEIVHELPKKVFPRRSKASSCREVMGEIKALTYLVHEEKVLERLHVSLLQLRDELQKAAPKENGLILEHDAKFKGSMQQSKDTKLDQHRIRECENYCTVLTTP
eukprot:Seg908.2 transcript_id=Seg908.2/GoldUCD/mRNA.D3Y31 product="hypothetical protein" protein_id=Seg908.2/GoldUCD/D3Y31